MKALIFKYVAYSCYPGETSAHDSTSIFVDDGFNIEVDEITDAMWDEIYEKAQDIYLGWQIDIDPNPTVEI